MFEGFLVQDKHTKVWQMRFFEEGDSAHCKSKSAKTKKRSEAKTRLDKFLAELNAEAPVQQTDKETVGDLVLAYIADMKMNHVDDAPKVEQRWKKHMENAFASVKIIQVTNKVLRSYVQKRQGEEIVMISVSKKTREIVESRTGKFPKNSTINRELSVIRAAFNLALENDEISRIPKFPMLSEKGNVRKGFLTDGQRDRLLQETTQEGLWLRAVIAVLSSYGWRKGEALEEVRVRMVDVKANTIQLEETKNGDGRLVVMNAEVRPLILACMEGKQPDDFLFTRDGQPIREFRKTWQNVCIRAGLGKMVKVKNLKHPRYEGLLVHDLRRTGCRNNRRLVGEALAMKASGHRTAATFKRYDIVSLEDMQELARKQDEAARSKEVCEGFCEGSIVGGSAAEQNLQKVQ
jgi:site-specific recombinase XerD